MPRLLWAPRHHCWHTGTITTHFYCAGCTGFAVWQTGTRQARQQPIFFCLCWLKRRSKHSFWSKEEPIHLRLVQARDDGNTDYAWGLLNQICILMWKGKIIKHQQNTLLLDMITLYHASHTMARKKCSRQLPCPHHLQSFRLRATLSTQVQIKEPSKLEQLK